MFSPIVWTALCLLALLAVASIRRVPEGHVYRFRRIGGHVRLVGSGTHLVLPLFERVAQKISLAGAAVTVDGLRQGERHERAVVYFQVLEPERAGAGMLDLDGRLREATHGLYTDAGLPDAADARRNRLKQALNAELRERGVLVARVDLQAQDH